MYWHRDQWMALPPKSKLDRLKRPVKKLVLSYKTHFPACFSQSHCEETVKKMQKYYMDVKGMADIPYNFVIGGDDEVYEGRGFKFRADKRLALSRWCKTKLHIAFIGDWTSEEPPKEMKELCTKFVNFAIEQNMLARDYGLFGVRGKYRGEVWDQHDEELKAMHEAERQLNAATAGIIDPYM